MSVAETDTRRLMSAISALTGREDRFGAKGRILTDQAASQESVLLAIVREVDETVLHRHLIFRFAAGRLLTLEVSERRVLKVVSTAEGVKKRQANIYDKELLAEDAEPLVRFLEEETRGENCVSVISVLPEASGRDYASGVSCEVLEQHVRAQREGQNDGSALSNAVSHTRLLSRACIVHFPGQPVTEFGPQFCVSALKQLYQTLANNALENGAKAWISKRSSSQAVLRVKHSEVFLLALMNSEAAAECVTSWSVLCSVARERV